MAHGSRCNMSYKMHLNTRVRQAVVSLWTKSASQVMSSGDVLTFDSARSTGTSGLSVDSSTGVITLTEGKDYWLQLSVDVSRSSTSATFAFELFDQTDTRLDHTQGVSRAKWNTAPSDGNVSLTLQALLHDATKTYRIKCTTSSGTVTTEAGFTLLVVETDSR